MWGLTTSIDLYDCDPALIRSRDAIKDYVEKLISALDMKAYGEPQIVHFGSGNKEGFTLVQLIETSNIIGHFSNDTNSGYIDIFSCKEYDPNHVADITAMHFRASKFSVATLERGE